MIDINPRAGLLAACCALAIALAGCSAAPPNSEPETSPTATDTLEPSTASAGPCELLSAERVGEAFGEDFGEGRSRSGTVIAQDVEWTTAGCVWETADEIEVTFSIAGADDFADGFECVEPSELLDDPTPVDGLGEIAWWVWDDFQGGFGELIVCAGDTRLELEVEGPREGPLLDEALIRDGAETLMAELV